MPKITVLLFNIIASSPAEEGGLEEGDYVLEVDHIPIRTSLSLRNQLYAQPPETKIHLKIKRDGEILEKTISLGEDVFSDHYFPDEDEVVL